MSEITSLPQTRSLTVVRPETQALVDRVSADLEIVDTIVIDSPQMLAEAVEIAGRLAGASSAIEAERKATVGPVNEVVHWINDGYFQARDYINDKIGGVRPKIVAYNAEMRRQAEARAAAERAKREAEAAEAAKREAEAVARANALLASAQQAEAAGSEIMAQGMLSQASVAVDAARQDAQAALVRAHSVQAMPAAQAKGIRGKWTGVVTDKYKLVQHIVALAVNGDLSLLGLIEINASALNGVASVQREHLRLPGVVANFAESVAIRKIAA